MLKKIIYTSALAISLSTSSSLPATADSWVGGANNALHIESIMVYLDSYILVGFKNQHKPNPGGSFEKCGTIPAPATIQSAVLKLDKSKGFEEAYTALLTARVSGQSVVLLVQGCSGNSQVIRTVGYGKKGWWNE